MNTLRPLRIFVFSSIATALIACAMRPPAPERSFDKSKAPEVGRGLSYDEYVKEWLYEKVSYVERNKRIPAAPSRYNIVGDCGGYPRVDVKTAPGFCLGLLDDGEGTSMPRWALALDANTIVMTDMVNWEPHQGRIYLLKKNGSLWSRTTLFDKSTFKGDPARLPIVDRPNQISRSPAGKVFVAGASGIMTFDP